jgi:hypothetical protein
MERQPGIKIIKISKLTSTDFCSYNFVPFYASRNQSKKKNGKVNQKPAHRNCVRA